MDARHHVVRGRVRLAEDAARGALELVDDDAGDGLHEGLVDLGLDRRGARVGDLGRDGVDLLVDVIVDVGLREISREDAREVGGEALRNHDGGVVPARTDAVKRVILVGRDPVELVVLGEFLEDHVAGVDVAEVASEVSALVVAHDGDAHARGVLVGVPVCCDVEPCVERWDDADAEGDDDRDGVAKDALEVAPKDSQCRSHASTPSDESDSFRMKRSRDWRRISPYRTTSPQTFTLFLAVDESRHFWLVFLKYAQKTIP